MTKRELRALGWCVQQAKAWRGSLVGDPDPAGLAAFDREVSVAQRAMRKLRLLKRNKAI